jgi:hypothetical protein
MKTIGISLGNVCYSAIYAVENGLRKKKADGYNTCPFDLMVSNYKGVVECIKNDFKFFCNPKFLQLQPHSLINTKYNFGFNHETPGHADLYLHENWAEGENHFINNNFKHFIERYKKRIQSFKRYLKNPNNFIIFIIQFTHEPHPEENLQSLRDALASKYPNLKYQINVIP